MRVRFQTPEKCEGWPDRGLGVRMAPSRRPGVPSWLWLLPMVFIIALLLLGMVRLLGLLPGLAAQLHCGGGGFAAAALLVLQLSDPLERTDGRRGGDIQGFQPVLHRDPQAQARTGGELGRYAAALAAQYQHQVATKVAVVER